MHEARDTFTFIAKGIVIRCVAVRGYENYKVDDEKGVISISCDPALSRVLREAEALEWLQGRMADLEFKTLFTERALRSLVAYVLGEFERLLSDFLIDEVKTPRQLRKRVREAMERMKSQLGTGLPAQAPRPSDRGGVEVASEAEEAA
jgi:hypothetical protein